MPMLPREERRRWLRPLAALVTAFVAGSAAAYEFEGYRWPLAGTDIQVALPGTARSGQRWQDALADAMAEWTSHTAFTFVAKDTYVDPCAGYGPSSGSYPAGSGDQRNSVDFSADLCGNAFGRNVLAVTLTHLFPGSLGFDYIMQSDILFNDLMAWDIYEGPLREAIDFRRVALHELGHVLGLGHERARSAIMQASISSVNRLQADDIAGANALYSIGGDCGIKSLPLNARRHGALQEGSCRILDLYIGSDDESLVDIYRISLAAQTTLQVQMDSTDLDPVLLITDPALGLVDILDKGGSGCNAAATLTLPAGDYLLLANTFVNPTECGGNRGEYSLSISTTGLPVLGAVGSTAAIDTFADTLIVGGANTGVGTPYRSGFGVSEQIDVEARIYPAPEHVGRAGKLHVLALLADGTAFVQDSAGGFAPFNGDLATLAARRQGTLQETESLVVASRLQAGTMGLAGQDIRVYVGYSLDDAPTVIHYASDPIRLVIGAQ